MLTYIMYTYAEEKGPITLGWVQPNIIMPHYPVWNMSYKIKLRILLQFQIFLYVRIPNRIL